jgi:hypothetical protein
MSLLSGVCAQTKKPVADLFSMGYFWTGNILINVREDKDDNNASVSSPTALVIDWELVNAGLPGLDVGQLCTKLAMLQPDSSGGAEAAVGEALASFMWAYIPGEVGPKADDTCRVMVGHGAPYCLNTKDVMRR